MTKIANKAMPTYLSPFTVTLLKVFSHLEPKHSSWGYPSDLNLEWQSRELCYFIEDNFKDTYQGFDPNKPESLIGLPFCKRRI
jgi:N-acetylmuramoyl-L-alanine amidase